MAKDQYQIPKQFYELEARAQLEAVQYSPEMRPAPYQRIKNIEDEIFSHRESALATDSSKKSWLSGLVFSPQDKTIHNLIEAESEMGGRLFGPGNRFWLDVKPGAVFNNEVADWYHARVNPQDPKNPIVIRFQTSPEKIYKLYEGVEYEPTIDELETFVAAVEAYANEARSLHDGL